MPIELQQHIDFIITAHQLHSTSPDKSVRSWDHQTPYAIHPIWCATTIAAEPLLPEDIREEGAVILLYHDILEDTDQLLPKFLTPDIQKSIKDMAFSKGTMGQEIFEIWEKEPKIRLFKLYDKVSNLLDATWMSDELKNKYKEYTKRLMQDVESHYGELNIVKFARAIT